MGNFANEKKCLISCFVLIGSWVLFAGVPGAFELVGNSAVFSFNSSAKGGGLYIVNKAQPDQPHVEVATNPSQTPEQVVMNVKRSLLTGQALERILTGFMQSQIDIKEYESRWQMDGEVSLDGFMGEIVIGGAEVGLGILPPVGSVSVGYDSQNNEHFFRWHEKSEYEDVYVCQFGAQGGKTAREAGSGLQIAVTVPGKARFGQECRAFYVVGFRSGLPTNASHVVFNRKEQLDYFFRPFTNGIATNWTGWNVVGKSPVQMEEREFSEAWKFPEIQSLELSKNQCAQILKCERGDEIGGMYRFFIAQTPSQAYRPALRCHIMKETEDFKGEWAFEIMTGVVNPEQAYEMDNATRVMTNDAWTELEANGEQISKWRFDHTIPRTDEWIMNQTGARDSEIPQKDIILGESKTAVFFCVRLTGHKPNGVAMDGVRLVDVTDGFPNAKIREKVL